MWTCYYFVLCIDISEKKKKKFSVVVFVFFKKKIRRRRWEDLRGGEGGLIKDAVE